jgi:CHAT domain
VVLLSSTETVTAESKAEVLVAVRALLHELGDLLGDEHAAELREKLLKLLARAEAGQAVDNDIRALLMGWDKAREWTNGYLRYGGSSGAKGPGGDPLIRRTPHLDAPKELPTEQGDRFEVEIWADKAPARTGEESEGIIVEAPPDVKTIELGVLLITSPHLSVEEPYFRPLTIDRYAESSERIVFNVAISGEDAPGAASLTAQFFYRGRPSGRVRRRWTWPGGRAQRADRSSAGVPAHTNADEPDLTVLITDTGAGRFTCSVRDRVSDRWTEPVEWEGVRDSVAPLVTGRLAQLVDRGRPAQKRRLALRTAGRAFWNIAPKPFRDALWELIDRREREGADGRASIYIASDEPLLPWEIMLPSRPRADGPDEERPLPLGAEFAVGRWVRGDAASPPQTLPILDSLLLAAHYSKENQALDPTTEREVLERCFRGRQLEHVTWEYLETKLQDDAASLLHFVCHGAAQGDDSTLFLDEFEEWTSAELRENKGLKAACAERLPIVFLNACDGGRQSLGLGPGGLGFPRMFSELGARAVVAPVWPVTKSSAPLVAKEIYEQADADPDRPLADVLADLRRRSYEEEPFEDSWAAYCLFGDPLAKLRRPS